MITPQKSTVNVLVKHNIYFSLNFYAKFSLTFGVQLTDHLIYLNISVPKYE